MRSLLVSIVLPQAGGNFNSEFAVHAQLFAKTAYNEGRCIMPFQHEMRAAPAGGGSQAQPVVATGRIVLAWLLDYTEMLEM